MNNNKIDNKEEAEVVERDKYKECTYYLKKAYDIYHNLNDDDKLKVDEFLDSLVKKDEEK